MVKRRLVSEIHGSDGYTSLPRLVAAFGLMVAVGLSAQLLMSSWYAGRLLPGTVVGDAHVGGLTLPQASAVLWRTIGNAQVQLAISGQQFTFTPDQLGATYDVNATLRQSYNAEHPQWQINPVTRQEPLAYHLDSSKLASVVGAVAGKIGTAPVDAAVVMVAGKATTIPDKNGYTVDKVGLAKLIEQNLGLGTSVDLAAAPHTQVADIVTARLASTVSAAQSLSGLSITLNYGNHVWTPSASVIGGWLAFERTTSDAGAPTLVPVVDKTKVTAYVAGLAKQVDVPAVTQLVTTQNGADTINQTGVNGTAIDQASTVAALATALTSKQALTFTITDSVVPFKVVNTSFTVLGYPKYIEINLAKQHAWVWQDGQIIYDTPITSGATGAGFGTVTGLFNIYYKSTNTWLNGQEYGPRYDYNDFVKYWMPFYSGYGLHDASWRHGNFGETSGPLGYLYDGSHGCVNLPDDAAAFIYNWSDVGTPVWVHN